MDRMRAERLANYEDYPELFVRWFEWGAFQPMMRAHGERNHNEVWSYGKQAEPILAKYLRLRYQLLPYTYSLPIAATRRALRICARCSWIFPHDPKVADIPDEYMYGPAFLVAPVTEQGATSGRCICRQAATGTTTGPMSGCRADRPLWRTLPIDTLPLFVRAGSIVPLGSEVESTQQTADDRVRARVSGSGRQLYPFQDDGKTYAYENGGGSVTKLTWDDAAHQLSHEGASASSELDKATVVVIGR